MLKLYIDGLTGCSYILNLLNIIKLTLLQKGCFQYVSVCKNAIQGKTTVEVAVWLPRATLLEVLF